jgi:hypothetical protein
MDEDLIKHLHDLTYRNMTSIIPSSISKEEGYGLWRKSFDRNITEGTRYIVDLHNNYLRGYLSYTIRSSKKDIYLNDIQVEPLYQGNGVTAGRLFHEFLREIRDCEWHTIRTYANNLNSLSQHILQKLRFEVESRTERGLRYRIEKEKL